MTYFAIFFLQDIEGFVFSPFKCFVSSIIVILTGGLFLILLTWRSDIKLNCLYQKVALRDASKILLKDKFHQIFEEDVSVQNRVGMVKREGDIEQLDRGLHFVNKKIKYVWDPNLQVSHHFLFFLTYVFPTKIKKMLLLAFLHLQAFSKSTSLFCANVVSVISKFKWALLLY